MFVHLLQKQVKQMCGRNSWAFCQMLAHSSKNVSAALMFFITSGWVGVLSGWLALACFLNARRMVRSHSPTLLGKDWISWTPSSFAVDAGIWNAFFNTLQVLEGAAKRIKSPASSSGGGCLMYNSPTGKRPATRCGLGLHQRFLHQPSWRGFNFDTREMPWTNQRVRFVYVHTHTHTHSLSSFSFLSFVSFPFIWLIVSFLLCFDTKASYHNHLSPLPQAKGSGDTASRSASIQCWPPFATLTRCSPTRNTRCGRSAI